MLKSPLSRSLRVIAAALDALDEQELEALVAGKGRLVFVPNDKAQERNEYSLVDMEAIAEQLFSCGDREQGRSVLSGITNKDALSALARSLKIHVAKHDRREDIENKIIETTIGARLRSEAIQTLNMKGDSR